MTIKFLSGGTAPFVQWLPVTVNTANSRAGEESSSRRSSSSSSSKNDGNVTQKDLLSLLKEIDGLPSDMELLYKQLTHFVHMEEMYGDVDTSMLATQYIQSLQNIKTAVYRKELFDSTYKKLQDNGGLNEVAVTNTGQVVCRNNEGKIAYFDPDKIEEGYSPLTNSNLLYMRANMPEFAGRDGDALLTNVASNGIGLETVNKMIHDFMISLGKDVTNVSSKQEEDLKLGAGYLYQLAQSGIDPSDFMGNKILSESQTRQAMLARDYIVSMLPKNAMAVLEYRASQMLSSDGTPVTGKDLVTILIGSGTSSKTVLGEGITGSKKSDSDKLGDGDFTSDQYTNIIRGLGYGSKSSFILMNSDGDTSTITGKAYPYIQDQNGNAIGTMSLSKALQAGVGQMFKSGNYAITFGDLVLNEDALHGVLYESDGSTMRVIMPVKEQNGKIVPDLDVAKENRELFDKINSSKDGINDPEVQEAIKKTGLFNDIYGNIDKSRFLTYLVVNGKSDDNVINPSEWVTEIVDPTDQQIGVLNKYLQEDNPDYEFDKYDTFWGIPNPGDWFGLHNKMYKGTIFIPLTENILSGATGMKKHYKEGTSHELESQYQNEEFKRYNSIDNEGMSRLDDGA